VKDFQLPSPRLGRVDQRAVLGGRLRQTCQHRRLTEGQVVGGGVVERARRRFDAVALAPVVDGVEIHLEDLLFRVAAVEVHRQRGLAQLALDGRWWIRADEDLLDQLLADRAAALVDVVVGIVGDRRPGDAADVDAAVLVKRPVFDRDRCLANEGRHGFQRNHDAMVTMITDVVDQRAMAVEDQHVLFEPAGR
jgi:hypothetical protein